MNELGNIWETGYEKEKPHFNNHLHSYCKEIEEHFLPNKFSGLKKQFLEFIKKTDIWDYHVSKSLDVLLSSGRFFCPPPQTGFDWDEWFKGKNLDFSIEYVKNVKSNITKAKNWTNLDYVDREQFMFDYALNMFKEYIFNRFSQHDWDTEETYWDRVDLLLKLREQMEYKNPRQPFMAKIDWDFNYIEEGEKQEQYDSNIDQLVQQTSPELHEFEKNQIKKLLNEHFQSLQTNYPKEFKMQQLISSLKNNLKHR